MSKLEKGMKVKCTKSGLVGKIVKLGGRTSKVKVPIFGTQTHVVKQIPNRYLKER